MTDKPEGVLHMPEREHWCMPPGHTGPLLWATMPVGTVWKCTCSLVWVVRWVPTKHFGYHAIVSHGEWFRESRRQRRRRLGLRWWQKEAQ